MPLAHCRTDGGAPRLKIGTSRDYYHCGQQRELQSPQQAGVETVKDLLTGLRMEAERTTAIGLGYDHKFHIPGIGPDGKLNSNASANQSVIVFSASERTSAELLTD